MSSYIDKIRSKGLISPPSWMENNVVYETIMGSVAYGVSDDTSDMDIYGIVIPPKRIVFPHTNGYIHGFDNPVNFESYQQHHIKDT